MSRWEEQFNSHPLHQTLKDAESLISTEKEDVTEDEMPEKRRANKLLNAYTQTLAQLDPELVPFNNLDSINNQIRHANIWNQLTAYNQNGNASHLKNANDHLTSTLAHLAQLLSISKSTEATNPLRALEKSLDEFAAAISSKKDSLQAEISGHKGELTKQQKELTNLASLLQQKKQETDQMLAEWQKQFSEAQNTRNETFSSDQKGRTAEFNQWRKDTTKEIKDAFDNLLQQTSERISKTESDFEDTINNHLEDADAKHKRILELYQITAADSVGAGYIKNADNEREQANFWRWATITFVGLTAIWTGVSYFLGPLSGDEPGTVLLGKVIKAFSVTGVLLFGAVYSAKQSNAHRNNERRNRRFALEVKAIDPFIASLDDADQKTLKKELSERLFGHQDGASDNDSKVIEEHAFSTVVKGLIDVLKASK
ncbi:MAG: hypothetical protein ACPGGN_03555 [Opitutales bacterium]